MSPREEQEKLEDGARPERRPTPRVTELRLLYRVSTELNAAHDRARILEVLLDTLEEAFGFQHCSVFMLDPEAGVLDRAASRGASPRRLGSRIRLGSGIVGAAAARREIVRLNRASTPFATEPEQKIAGYLAVPMLAQDSLVGVLYLLTLSGRPLRKDDEVWVNIVANQAAVALENARLYADLERRVEARTAELAAANLKLREAQAELVQSGKMAALGQLAAGLAHETNTPLGAIRSSVDVIDRALARLRESAELRPAPAEPHGSGRLLSAVEQANRTTRDASARLFTIFETLRNFAQLDRSALQLADLHEGLESALGLLVHRLGGRVEVVRDYGALPRVRCFASELNQVFSIVLTNAIEAIDGPGAIILRTRAAEQVVTIEITDTGRGMAPEHLERAFDPGFTTKGVGVGTGLSLAIAFRIIERHQGRIRLVSSPSQGTSVHIELPLPAAS